MNELETFHALPMLNEHVDFAISIITSDKNKAVLHLGGRSVYEWCEALTKNLSDPDEANFIIRRGSTPVAWLKINGMVSNKKAAISMLVVHEEHQRQGAGSFAVRYAEDYIASKGFEGMSIHTTIDNTAAVNCYKKLGYTIFKIAECAGDDGAKRQGVTFYRDRLCAVRMSIDGVPFYIREPHDFSFLNKLGKVFKVFYAMDSGNVCFGVEKDGERFFVKYAGARTTEYKSEIADAVDLLKNAIAIYEDLRHPYLIRLVDHFPVGDGYAAVFGWADGEGLRSYWEYVEEAMWKHPASPVYRFRRLPIKKRIAAVDVIMEFHRHAVERGYVPVDFYDGSLLYDFKTDELHICDIDFYRKMPAVNEMGRMWGSARFMSPEERELGAQLDEIKTVHNMGAAMFELLCTASKDAYDIDRSFDAWSASRALYDVAVKAVAGRAERYQTLAGLIAAWNAAKDADDIIYRRLHKDDLAPDMLKTFNRFQKIEQSWRKRDGAWALEDNPHVIDWDESKTRELATEDFPQLINSGGALFCAYDESKLIGFCGFDGNIIGSGSQYLWLVVIHVSYEYRGNGVGRRLFIMAADAARALGAAKLYVSANSSRESQAFYRSIGCADAGEVIPELFEVEPYDVHMEYVL